VEIRIEDSLDDVSWTALSDVYARAPLGYKEPERLRVVFSNSQYRCLLYVQGELVGAARAFSDGLDCAVICDVAIVPERQGLGLGNALVQHLLRQVRGYKRVLLFCSPGKEAFYERHGFRKMTTAMAIFDDETSARAQGLIE
jgi:ribosomal protein S18 acetylase RimI-like enzyme